jgi:membrane protein
MTTNIVQFIKDDLWSLPEQSLPRYKTFFIKGLKIFILAVQGFQSDLCSLGASALTLYSLLSIVPIIAMLFGIAKGFGFEQMLLQYLLENSANQKALVLQLIDFSQNLLKNTQGGVVAGVGIITLFWTIISVISNIETSFNAIWKITENRPFSRKFSDYLSLMLIAPIILIATSSLTVFLQTQITVIVEFLPLPKGSTWLIFKLLNLSSLLLIISLFTFVLIFVPNHKVQFRAGLVAGVLTGILYFIVQQAYIKLQVGVSSYNAIYGSFAALPLFLAWLQIGWMIVLLGCEIAFYLQNYETYQHHNRFNNLSFTLQKTIALQISQWVVKNFQLMQPPPNADQIATALDLPIAVIQPILNQLTASRVLLTYKIEADPDNVYQPAIDINKISVAYVITALEQCGRNHLSDIKQEQAFKTTLGHFRDLMEQSKHNALLKDPV